MATTAIAAAGPPPGLGPRRTADASGSTPETSLPHPPPGLGTSPQAGFSGGGNGGKAHRGNLVAEENHTPAAPSRIMPGAASKTYTPAFLLALSKSPLVHSRDDMPKLSEWYGDWEPYHHRPAHGGGGGGSGAGAVGGLPNSPMGSFGKADRFGRGSDRHQNLQGGGMVDEYEGGSGSLGAKKERFRRGGPGDERAEAARYNNDSNASRRFPNTGKNPFGQVSASGTFKPAGRDNSGMVDGMGDRRGLVMGGRLGRERDVPPHTVGGSDERGGARQRNGREFGTPKDRRLKPGADNREDGDEWESVPRSPENDRRARMGHAADSAADWRRGGAPGERGGPGRGDGWSERDAGRKTAFPAWMAEESEPAWMASDGDGSSSGKGRPLESLDDRDVDDVDTSGMDGIQAFKARMKEKERRERERIGSATPTATPTKASGPPPGLERLSEQSQTEEHSFQHDSPSASRQQASLFDDFASAGAQRNEGGAEAGSVEPPGLPGRASRFARFFDGKPQAAALAAQQRQLGGAMSANAETSQEGGTHSPATPQKAAPSALRSTGSPAPPSSGIADLFRSMNVSREQQQQVHSPGRGDATATAAGNAPPMQRNPSEADVQGMQKIMALLSGGGNAGGGSSTPSAQHHNPQRDGTQPRGPAPPPGIDVAALQQRHGQQQGEHGSPAPSGSQRQGSPGPPYHAHYSQASPTPQSGAASSVSHHNEQQQQHQQGPHAPPQMQGNRGGWHSPSLSFEGPRGIPGYGPPPPPGVDPRMIGGPRQGPGGLPHGLPPHVAMMLAGRGGPGGMGALPQGMARGVPPGNFGPAGFPPGMRPPGPPPQLPPQLQQQLAGLPPQAQHQLLAQHFHGGGPGSPFGGGTPPPPPPGMHQQQQQQQGPMYGSSPFSPMSHHYGQGPGTPHSGPTASSGGGGPDANSQGAAHLMALLGQGGGGGGGGGGK